ncbi:hypothetical protein OIU78_018144 [Salix suchowensis]|nr:hypothetical protein OIU78_018144 [Salix suchowensis]
MVDSEFGSNRRTATKEAFSLTVAWKERLQHFLYNLLSLSSDKKPSLYYQIIMTVGDNVLVIGKDSSWYITLAKVVGVAEFVDEWQWRLVEAAVDMNPLPILN